MIFFICVEVTTFLLIIAETNIKKKIVDTMVLQHFAVSAAVVEMPPLSCGGL